MRDDTQQPARSLLRLVLLPTIGEAPMQLIEIEGIARTVLRDYGLPLQFEAISPERAGQCTVAFSDAFSGATVCVGVWCDAKVSPHQVRESLKRWLHVSE